MRSAKQIAASYANGARSRGPVTVRGKQNSSRNGFRQGFSRHDPALYQNPRDAFKTLRTGFEHSFEPATPFEFQLVPLMAVAHWRKQQVQEAHTIAMKKAMASQQSKTRDRLMQAVLSFEHSTECHALRRY